MNFTGNTKTLLLVHKQMPYQTLETSVNLMLSPQFYTLKREEVPVRYAYQAKAIAPSLFDGLLEIKSGTRYFVSKEENSWLFIAYDIDEIEEFLEKKGIAVDKVDKLFFSEQGIENFDKPIKIGDSEALAVLNGSVVVIPQVALEEESLSQDINHSFTPAKGVTLEGGKSSIFEKKDAYILAAVFSIFALIFFAEGMRYAQENTTEIKEMEALLQSHPSLKSSYTRESIGSKYRSINKKERKKREVINRLSQMIFKGVTLTTFSIDDKEFHAVFDCKNQKVVKKLQDLARQQKFNAIRVPKSNSLKIGAVL
ncbi:hypothetical protein MNB_SV-3-174 [hydrothermal vent metagenome]|uniref:Uncharacterized protein n=1 Tax=hydrothermal vent metagenome TaxID=652676 RepID=A0A1W1BRV7_9ZZZZ